MRDDILNERFDYQGDIKRVYDAAWRDVEGETEVRRVLAYVARAEGPLDPELIGEVQNVIRRLATTTNMTMLMVTHEMRFAREISDRVVMFDKGQVVERGTPEEIFGNPQEARTRQFLDSVTQH